jgi:hypothetical protein
MSPLPSTDHEAALTKGRPLLKTFRIFVHEWTVWSMTIDAYSEQHAEKIGRDLWDTHGHGPFHCFNSGDDGVTAEAFEPEGGAL